jgi:VCBS repeat-containing protein
MPAPWWLRRTQQTLTPAAARPARRPKPARPGRCQPRVETLEDRAVPAGRLFAAAPAVGTGTALISEFDPATGTVLRSFRAPETTDPGDAGLAFDGIHLFYLNGRGSDILYQLDPVSGAVLDQDLVAAGSGNYDGLAVVAGQVYIQDYANNVIHVFDPATDAVVRTVTPQASTFFPDLAGGLAGATGPDGLIATIVSTGGDTRVVELNPVTGAIVRLFNPDFTDLRGVAVVDNEIYLGSAADGLAYKYSRTGTFLGQVVIPAGTAALGGDDAVPAGTGTVAGVKYDDRNGDGTRNAGEPGLPGWTVYADLNNSGNFDAGEPSAVTGADGSYSLTAPAGTYRVREVSQAGWVATAPLSYPFYASGNDGTQLIRVDPAAGSAAVVGAFGPTTARTYAGAFTPDGTYWTVTNSTTPGQAQLARVNLATGAATPVGAPLAETSPMVALEGAPDGTLYGATVGGRLYRLNTTTGAATLVGPSGVDGITDLAFDAAGTLWAVLTDRLIRLNTTTGAATHVAALSGLGGPLARGLSIHPQTGVFYLTTFATDSALFTLNPATGAATRVAAAPLGVPAVHGGDISVQDGHPVTVTAGATLTGLDFGNARSQGVVSGVKFEDLDLDGTRDPGEQGLPGWTVYADLNNNGSPDANEPAAVTGPDGSYSLTVPVGTHSIREVPQVGWVQTGPTGGRLFTIRSAQNGTPTIAELDATGAVLNSFPAPAPVASGGPLALADGGAGLFYVDGNYFGTYDALLYELDPFTGAVRDADGFPIAGPVTGAAVVNGLVYLATGPNQIVVFDPVTDTVVRTLTVPGQPVSGGLAGGGGLLFVAVGGDVLALDPVTGAVVRTLSPNIGVITGGLAYRDGELLAVTYSATSVPPIYRVNPVTGAVLGTITLPGGPPVGALGGDGAVPGPHRVTVAAGATLTGRDFGNVRDQGVVTGVKFEDLDLDGTRDPGEQGLPGWTIYADLNNNGRLDLNEPSAVTGPDGSYSLAVPTGVRAVREVPQAGWVQTGPTGGRLFAVRTGPAGNLPVILEYGPAGDILNSFIGPAPVPAPGPQGLADGGTSLFYTDGGVSNAPPRLYELDPFTGAVRDEDFLTMPGQIAGLAFLDGLVYVLTSQNQITAFDPVTDTVVRTLSIPGQPLTGGFAAGGGLLYAASAGDVFALDPVTGAVVRTLSPNVGFINGGLAYRDGELVLAAFGASPPGLVHRVHPVTGAHLGSTVLIGVGPVSGLGGDGAVPGPHRVRLTPGSALTGRDFGNVRAQGTVSGVKFEDLDLDGTRDPGEQGLPGWTVYADLNNNGSPDANEPSAVTGPDGSYSLTVPVGTHSIREVPQAGWVQTGPTAGRLFAVRTGPAGTTIQELGPTGAVLNSFPAPAAVISGGPQGLADGGTSLFYMDGSAGTAAAPFLYELDPFTGAVRDQDFLPVPGPVAGLAFLGGLVYVQSAPNQITVFDPVTDTVVRTLTTGGQPVFGGLAGGGGLLFASAGNDVLVLDPATGAVVRTLSPGIGATNGGLAYRDGELLVVAFNAPSLPPIYRVNPVTGAVLGTVALPAGSPASALGGDGAVPGPHRVTVAAGTAQTGRDFGNVRDQGVVSGVKFEDLDLDGTRDPGEQGLPGWTIYADLNNNGRPDANEPSAVTGADGSYSLTVPSGTHSIREVPQAGWEQTGPRAGRLFVVRGATNTTPTIQELGPTGAVLNSFPAPAAIGAAGPQGLADGGTSLFYLDSSPVPFGAPVLYELDPATGSVRDKDFLAGSTGQPSGLAALGGLVYVLANNAGRVIVIDPATDTVVRTLDVANLALVGGLTGAGDQGLLFGATSSNQIVAFDPATGALVRTLSPATGQLAGGLAYRDGELLAAPFRTSGTTPIYRINPQTGGVTGVFSTTSTLPVVGLGGDGPVPGPHRVFVGAGLTAAGRDFGNRRVGPPAAGDDVGTVGEDTTLTVAAPGVLANDVGGTGAKVVTAVNGSAAAVGQTVTLPSGSTLRVNADGSYVYTPAASYNALRAGQSATDTFTYTVADDLGANDTATVTVTILGANDGPTGEPDAYTTSEDAPLAGDVLANDGDPDGGDTRTVVEVNGNPTLVGQLITLPSGARLTVRADGTFDYDPRGAFDRLLPGQTALDRFVYTAADGTGARTIATVTITVTGVNDAPTAVADAGQTPEDTALTAAAPGLLGNDTDPDVGDTRVVTAVNGSAAAVGQTVTLPSGSTLRVNADGSYVYTPAASYNALRAGQSATDTFTYTVADGASVASSATVAVTILGTNDAPTPAADAFATTEDAAVSGAVLDNDTDPDAGDTRTVVGVNGNPAVVGSTITLPSGARLTLRATGTFDYDPRGAFDFLRAGQSTTDSFTYAVADSSSAVATATVTVTINGRNDDPVAVPDVGRTDEDTPLTVAAPGVLGNDTDPDAGDTRVVAAVRGNPAAVGQPVALPSGARITLRADGSYVYDPNGAFDSLRPGETATDAISYATADAAGVVVPATLTITVDGRNDDPVAADDVGTTDEDTVLTTAPNLLGNDTDPDAGTALAVVAVNGSAAAVGVPVALPSGAVLTVFADGRYTYNPSGAFDDLAPGQSATDTFTYLAGDGTETSLAEVTITVTGVNDAPVAEGVAVTVGEDGPVVVGAFDAADAEGDARTFAVLTPPAAGQVVNNGDGTFAFDPGSSFDTLPAGATRTVTFTYRATDARDAAGNVATVTVTVTGVNDAPTADDGELTTPEDTAAGGRLTASDVDGPALTYAVVQEPEHGTLVLNANGTFTYTPDANYSGPDSFTYQAGDGSAASNVARVGITVTPVNDTPVAASGSGSTPRNTPLAVDLTALVSDVETADAALTYVIVSGPTRGTLAPVAGQPGRYVYTPNANVSGADSFTFRVSDGSAQSAVVTFQLTVTGGTNRAPVAKAQSVTTNEDTPLSGQLAATDADGDALTYVLVAAPTRGTVVVNPNGTFIYTPAANYSGSDSFTFKARDGSADSNVARVSVTVKAVNDAPVARADAYAVDEDDDLRVLATGILANDTDVDGGTLTAALRTGPAHGTVRVSSNGSFRYTPDDDYSGPDSFTYTVSDGRGGTAVGTVTITVRPVNDRPTLGGRTFSLPENSPNGTAVGTVTGADVDGDVLAYRITSGNTSGAFAIDPATGKLTVANSAALDYEVRTSFTLTVEVRDPAGLTAKATVTVKLTNVVEAPRLRIDVAPNDRDNRIDLRGTSRVSVALLSSSDFDARNVDVNSLRFGRTGREDSLSRQWSGTPRYKLEDVNGDGRLDLVAEFDVADTGFRAGDTTGILTGKMRDGTAFSAEDRVSVRDSRGRC